LPNVDIKSDPETDEIIMRNPWMMYGYYKDEEKTKEVLRDGWIHTGDQGHLDSEGYLRITGRVKDTFKTAKGKFIVPAPIEWKFSKNSYIESIAVVGLGLPQPLALVNLSEIGQKFSQTEINENFQAQLQEVNESLVSYQKVNSIIILNEMWTIDNKILTPTMKVKRNELNRRYQEKYEAWHDQAEKVIWE
ncbi:MAG: AMP-dependent synthetase, partial [Saprospiraceae bacterium]